MSSALTTPQAAPIKYVCEVEGCSIGDCPNCRYVRSLDARATAAIAAAEELIREAASDPDAFAQRVAHNDAGMIRDLYTAVDLAGEPVVNLPDAEGVERLRKAWKKYGAEATLTDGHTRTCPKHATAFARCNCPFDQLDMAMCGLGLAR
jgi:predicted ArsR family transcriptional regulator